MDTRKAEWRLGRSSESWRLYQQIDEHQKDEDKACNGSQRDGSQVDQQLLEYRLGKAVWACGMECDDSDIQAVTDEPSSHLFSFC